MLANKEGFMIVRPMFNLVLLPDVNYYFKNDFLKDWSLFPIEEKEEILFLVLRENKPRAELQPDDFYPVGVSAKIETVEEDGNLRIHTRQNGSGSFTRYFYSLFSDISGGCGREAIFSSGRLFQRQSVR